MYQEEFQRVAMLVSHRISRLKSSRTLETKEIFGTSAFKVPFIRYESELCLYTPVRRWEKCFKERIQDEEI